MSNNRRFGLISCHLIKFESNNYVIGESIEKSQQKSAFDEDII